MCTTKWCVQIPSGSYATNYGQHWIQPIWISIFASLPMDTPRKREKKTEHIRIVAHGAYWSVSSIQLVHVLVICTKTKSWIMCIVLLNMFHCKVLRSVLIIWLWIGKWLRTVVKEIWGIGCNTRWEKEHQGINLCRTSLSMEEPAIQQNKNSISRNSKKVYAFIIW